MISLILDTNTILRFLLADVPDQHKKSELIFSKIENNKTRGILSILVVNETIWALEKFYEKSKGLSLEALAKILSLKNIKVLEIDKKDLSKILQSCLELNIDFTDAYLLWIKDRNNYELATFDKKFLNNL